MTTQSLDNDVTQDTISMFVDVDFNPAIYVDTLFQSILANQPQYSKQALSKLSSNISYLITHLDYYTNWIVHVTPAKAWAAWKEFQPCSSGPWWRVSVVYKVAILRQHLE